MEKVKIAHQASDIKRGQEIELTLKDVSILDDLGHVIDREFDEIENEDLARDIHHRKLLKEKNKLPFQYDLSEDGEDDDDFEQDDQILRKNHFLEDQEAKTSLGTKRPTQGFLIHPDQSVTDTWESKKKRKEGSVSLDSRVTFQSDFFSASEIKIRRPKAVPKKSLPLSTPSNEDALDFIAENSLLLGNDSSEHFASKVKRGLRQDTERARDVGARRAYESVQGRRDLSDDEEGEEGEVGRGEEREEVKREGEVKRETGEERGVVFRKKMVARRGEGDDESVLLSRLNRVKQNGMKGVIKEEIKEEEKGNVFVGEGEMGEKGEKMVLNITKESANSILTPLEKLEQVQRETFTGSDVLQQERRQRQQQANKRIDAIVHQINKDTNQEGEEAMLDEEEEVSEEVEDSVTQEASLTGIASVLNYIRERNMNSDHLLSIKKDKDETLGKKKVFHYSTNQEYEGPYEKFNEIVQKDEYGRELSKQEAYKKLSWKFHGVQPSKRSMEKRMLRVEREKKDMSLLLSSNSATATQQALKQEQEKNKKHYMVL